MEFSIDHEIRASLALIRAQPPRQMNRGIQPAVLHMLVDRGKVI